VTIKNSKKQAIRGLVTWLLHKPNQPLMIQFSIQIVNKRKAKFR